MADFACGMCAYVGISKAKAILHIIKRHQHEANFYVSCMEKDCMYSCRSWLTFKQHYRRKHNVTNMQEYYREPNDIIPYDTDNYCMAQPTPLQNLHLDRIVGKYIMNLETSHRLSKKAVVEIAGTTNSLISTVLESVQSKVSNKLADCDCDLDISDCFSVDSNWPAMQSHARRKSFYQQYFKYIPPMKVCIGLKRIHKKGVLIIKKKYGYFVPLESLIKCLLNNPKIWEYYSNVTQRNSNDELMFDFCDGSYIRNHHFTKNGQPFLQLLMSYDDIEIQNPLRSSHVHKLAMFYLSILNIPVEFRSVLKNIYLIAICRTVDIRKYGLSQILKDFVTTVDRLKQVGIEMEVQGTMHNIRGDLIGACCDTPAAALLGGFKESSSFAWKMCRMCTTTADSMQTMHSSSSINLRTMTEYNDHCKVLENVTLTDNNKAYWSKMYGVNNRSVLFGIHDFPITQNLLQDPMHCLLEGVFAHVLALLLRRIVVELDLISIDEINNFLKEFPYSTIDKNCEPLPIERGNLTKTVNIKQKAACMLTLSYLLPYMLGQVLPFEDEYYRNFLALTKICHLCFTPYADQTTVGELDQLVSTFLQKFTGLYPDTPIRPKMHFMLHLPNQLQLFGPLRHHSTIRFEAKHGFFKDARWRNFKNLPLSMAEKHQLWLAHQITNCNGDYNPNYIYNGDIRETSNNFELSEILSWRTMLEVNDDTSIAKLDSLITDGMKYTPGLVLVSDYSESGGPAFAKILFILIINSRYYFLCKHLEILDFHSNFDSYEISEAIHAPCVLIHDQLRYRWPLAIYCVTGKHLLCDRYTYIGLSY